MGRGLGGVCPPVAKADQGSLGPLLLRPSALHYPRFQNPARPVFNSAKSDPLTGGLSARANECEETNRPIATTPATGSIAASATHRRSIDSNGCIGLFASLFLTKRIDIHSPIGWVGWKYTESLCIFQPSGRTGRGWGAGRHCGGSALSISPVIKAVVSRRGGAGDGKCQ